MLKGCYLIEYKIKKLIVIAEHIILPTNISASWDLLGLPTIQCGRIEHIQQYTL